MAVRSTQIQSALDGLDQEFPANAAEKFATLLGELQRWNRKFNLTAIRDPYEMITGHLLDSLVARPFLDGDCVLDVGTGAGFPGLPLAIVEPGRHFVLADSNNKKIQFVRHVVGVLELGNVETVRSRTEDYAPGNCFDTVVARAVAGLPKLLEIAGHHVGEGGVFVALKGRYPAEEIQQLPADWNYMVTELSVPGLDVGARHAVLLRRV